jgi:tetratricopeptide (TPR) repeat protein
MRKRLKRAYFSSTAAAIVLGLTLAACSSPEQKAQNYYAEGTKLLKQHDYAKAGLEFKNALQLKKDMLPAWRGLLEVEENAKDVGGVVQVLRNIVELAPKDVDATLRLGHLLLLGGDVQKAMELANTGTTLAPKSAPALAFRASVLLKMDNAVEARREAQAALDLDPLNAEAMIVLAADRVKQNDVNGALAILDAHADQHTKDLGVQLFKLSLYQKLNDNQRVEQQLKLLIGLYPKQTNFYQQLATLYIDEKRFPDAEREYRTISDAEPDNVQVGLQLVQLIKQTKGPTAARDELLARIKAGKQAAKYTMALASFDFVQGHPDQSVKELSDLISQTKTKEDKNAARVELARMQLARKDSDAAEKTVAEVLKDDERNTDALMLRATMRLDRGETEPAINDLRQALNDQPRSSNLMVTLAAAYERSGSMDLAEKEYADALQASNYAPAIVLNDVAFLRRRGNLERAEEIVVEALRRSPQNVPMLTTLAEVRLSRQNWAGAQAVATEIGKIKGAESIGNDILAAALNGEGKFDSSIKLLKNVDNATKNSPQAMVALVNTMVRAGKFDDAQAFLEAVLRGKPRDAEAMLLLGTVQFQKKEMDKAEGSFRAAVDIAPNNAGGYVALSQLYSAENKVDLAEATIRSGLKVIPESAPLHENLAQILEREGEIDQAIAEYQYLMKQVPGSLVYANNLASLLSDTRSDKQSIERAYNLALMLAKSPVPAFKDTVGWITYLHGDTKQAADLLQQAAVAMPDHAIVQYHLGVVYEADKRIDQAHDQFTKALKLNPSPALSEKIKAADAKLGM